MLVHHADAKTVGIVGVVDLDDLAVLFDDAFLGLIQTEQHAHQRGFTGAVFTQECVDLALAQLEGDIVVCDDSGETLGDIEHFNRVWFLQASHLLF